MNNQGHILIVDDEPAVVYTLKCILEKVGYTVSEAGTGAQAAEQLQSANDIDVIICDLGLAGEQSGIEVLAKAADIRPGMGRVVLTGYASPETVEELESNGNAVFFKPVEMGRLLPELQRIIERKAA